MSRRPLAGAVVALVLVLVAGLAACSDGGSSTASQTRPPGTSGGTGGGSTAAGAAARSIGTGPTQFHRQTVDLCVRLADATPGPGGDLGPLVDKYTAAQATLQGLTSRTAADDAVLAFVTARLAWLRTSRQDGPGRAGPAPVLPPTAATCRTVGTALGH